MRTSIRALVAVGLRMHIQRALVLGREIAKIALETAALCVKLSHVQISIRDGLEEPVAERTCILRHIVDEGVLPEPTLASSHVRATRTLHAHVFILRRNLRATFHRLRQVHYTESPTVFLDRTAPIITPVTRFLPHP